ncbi:DsbA family protein [Nitriliruptor alkaliphilus]|uniref:DsbA family protein n=1 Tax=Nitriliruptor alkaliphilus TaxID=427918 RepID=UPI000697480A|nr:DsbA family protein [Nitriliruptor alkaliphilus]
MTRRFALTFDYLCPFARNANEHVIAALQAGADWDVTFTPYSLAQGHVPEGDQAVWDREAPYAESGILALAVGLVVRDHHAERFLDVHRGLFAVRHDSGLDLKDPAALRTALTDAGLDAEDVLDRAQSVAVLKQLQGEHDAGVEDHAVWGVPTFIGSDRAVFVRLMDRPDGDAEHATRSIERVLDLVEEFPTLHEFKQTDLPR